MVLARATSSPPYSADPGGRWGSTRVELYDQLLIQVGVDVRPGRMLLHLGAERVDIPLQPLWGAASLGHVLELPEISPLTRSLAHLDLVPRLNQHGGNIGAPAVHLEVPVGDQLPALGPALGEIQPVHHVVQAALQHLQQVLAGQAALLQRLRIVAAELGLRDIVDAAGLLLLPQLPLGFGDPPAAELRLATVFSGRKVAALESALGGGAALALEKELLALPSSQFADRIGVLSHTLPASHPIG